MSRRLFVYLAIALFSLAACHVALAQFAPTLPGGGGRFPTMPPPPPVSNQGGFQQQNSGARPNVPGGNTGNTVAPGTNDDDTDMAPPEEKPEAVIDNEASPGLDASFSADVDGSWPMTGRDVSHSCYVPYKFTYPLNLYWKYVPKKVYSSPSSPVVADGIMYFTRAGRLYAMSAETGELRWIYPTDVALKGGISQAPLVGDDFVYIGTGDGQFYALTKKDGKWANGFATKEQVGISGAPILYNGVIYFGSADHCVYALDARTLKPVWKGGFRTGDALVGSPIVTGGLIYFLSNDNNLYVAGMSGKYRCAKVGATSKLSGPVFGDNLIFLAAGGNLKALLPQTLYEAWSLPLPAAITTRPVYGNHALYFATENSDPLYHGILYAVTRDGKTKWATKLKFAASGVPVIAGDTLIVGGGNGRITAVDCATGAIKWTYDVQPAAHDEGRYEYVNLTSPMIVYNGTLYTFSDDGTLYAFKSDITDTTPPSILQVSPNAGARLPGAGTLTVAAIVSEEGSGIDWSTVSMSLDGTPVEYKTSPQHNNLIYFKRKPKLDGTLSLLSDGRHTLAVSLSDWSGNKVVKEWNFIVDNTLTVSPEEKEQIDNTAQRATPGGAPGAGGRMGPGMGGPGGGPGMGGRMGGRGFGPGGPGGGGGYPGGAPGY